MEYLTTIHEGNRKLNIFTFNMPTFTPRPSFLRNLKKLGNDIFPKWNEPTQRLHIMGKKLGKRPHVEMSIHRAGMMNWELEAHAIRRLELARKWQHMTTNEYFDEIDDHNLAIDLDSKRIAVEEMEDYANDSYFQKKMIQEQLDNDFGKVKTIY